MSEDRKKNGCGLAINLLGDIHFSCIGAPKCGFKMKNETSFCSYYDDGDCSNEEAQTDAMNRASGSINEELCRRANNPETWTEEHIKKAEEEAEFIRRTLNLDEDETVERSR